MTSPQFDQYINRGIVHTDIPTFENFFTGVRPHKHPVRYQGDGTVDVTRRYAGDEQPGMSHVLAASRVPAGFGDYSHGVIIAYTSTGFTDDTLTSAHGTIGPSNAVVDDVAHATQVQGYYPRVLRAGKTYKVRIAIHAPVSSVYDYDSEWVQLTSSSIFTFSGFNGETNLPYGGLYNGLPIPSDDPNFAFNNGTWGHWPNVNDGTMSSDFPNSLPLFFGGNATFVTQDIGNKLLFVYDADAQSGSNTGGRGYILKINPDLTVVTGDLNMVQYYTSRGQGSPRIPQARRYFLTEDVDPILFAYASGQTWNAPLSAVFGGAFGVLGSVVPGWSDFAQSTPPLYSGHHTTGSGYIGGTYQYIGPDACAYNGRSMLKEFEDVYDHGAAAMNFVKPWSTGNYGAPELWMLRCDSDNRTYSIYRSEFEAGAYKPPSDPPGTPITGHSWGESYGLISDETFPLVAPGCGLNGGFINSYRTNDDTDYRYCDVFQSSVWVPSTGKNEFPKYNPKGYAFNKDFYKPANLVSRITLPSAGPANDALWEFSGNGHQFPFPWGRSTLAFKVWRGKNNGVLHMILIDRQNLEGSLAGLANSGFTGNPYYNAVRPIAGTMVWFATSSNDGKTWDVQAHKNSPYGGKVNGKPIANDSEFINQPVEPNGLIKRSFFTVGAETNTYIVEDQFLNAVFVDSTDHYVWAGCDYWHYFNRVDDTTEKRYPFWNKSSADAGNHVALWFLGEAVDIGSGVGGPSTVVFSASRRAL